MSLSHLKGNGWHIKYVTVEGDQRFPNNKEAIIYASSATQAQAVANLIFAAQYLENGTDIVGSTPHNVVPYINLLHSQPNSDILWEERCSDFTPQYCTIAAKASLETRTEIALSKFQLSCELFSTHRNDACDFYDEDPLLSPYAHDHVRMAYAIVIAYAVIEELGLEVRVRDIEKTVEKADGKYIFKEKESSKLSNGEWNSRVKQDLEERLLASHINLNEKFYWTARGGETPLESKRPPKINRLWPEKTLIRDGEIDIIDAISHINVSST